EAAAAPVFNFKNEITMAIAIVGVEGSMDLSRDGPTLTALRRTGHELSRRLGATLEQGRVFLSVESGRPEPGAWIDARVGESTRLLRFQGSASRRASVLRWQCDSGVPGRALKRYKFTACGAVLYHF